MYSGLYYRGLYYRELYHTTEVSKSSAFRLPISQQDAPTGPKDSWLEKIGSIFRSIGAFFARFLCGVTPQDDLRPDGEGALSMGSRAVSVVEAEEEPKGELPMGSSAVSVVEAEEESTAESLEGGRVALRDDHMFLLACTGYADLTDPKIPDTSEKSGTSQHSKIIHSSPNGPATVEEAEYLNESGEGVVPVAREFPATNPFSKHFAPD